MDSGEGSSGRTPSRGDVRNRAIMAACHRFRFLNLTAVSAMSPRDDDTYGLSTSHSGRYSQILPLYLALSAFMKGSSLCNGSSLLPKPLEIDVWRFYAITSSIYDGLRETLMQLP